MLISFTFARRVRPIYRSLRKDAEQIDGRVGETFSGIRVVRAFGREIARAARLHARAAHRAAQGAVRAAPRDGDLDVVGPAHRRGERGDRLVRRLPEPRAAARRSATSWRSSGTRSCCSTRSGTSSIRSPSCSARWPRWSACSRCSAMDADKPDRPGRRGRAARSCTRFAFEDVEFEYREGRPVVRDFSVTVPGGSVIALVGRSGAGKTTVTDLVARFHDPTRGRILLNGADIRDFRLAVVPRSARHRAAGRVPVRRLGARQHRVRPPRRHRRGGARTPRAAPTRTSSS